MFGGGYSNPYDDIVSKTTDENLTSENWELILNLCDKVNDEGQDGARNVVAAVLKRLAHRNPNVQLYALSLAESLSKNCGIQVHREIASRAFTQGLEKLITDRNTHDKVRKRALGLVATWTEEFESDSTLGVMQDCYDSLEAKNYKFETSQEPLPPTVDDEIRRKEEEELQRVLEMSMQDKGGRDQWPAYLSSGAGASGSGAASSSNRSASGSYASNGYHAPAASSSTPSYAQPTYQAGYAPAAAQIRSPSPEIQPAQSPPPQQLGAIITRVRALHTFEPSEPGELAFEKGDIIKVVDRNYKDWWRGQLKGRTGIFPVNYVEALPEPTAAELAKEAEQEAAVFAQAVNVEKLLNMLRALDPAKDNLADNEEIQELYRSSMALRPKIVKLIDKYSQKRADLVSMNETFVRARTIFDRMMEESLARHTGMYDQPGFGQAYGPRPDSGAPQYNYPQQSAYSAFPTPGQPTTGPGYPVVGQSRFSTAPNYSAPGGGTSVPSSPGITQSFPQAVSQQGYPAQGPGQQQGYPPSQYGLPNGPQPHQQPPAQQPGYADPQSRPQPQQQPAYQPPQPQPQQQQQASGPDYTQPIYGSQQQQSGYSAYASPYPAQQAQQPGPNPQAHPQPSQSPQPQLQSQPLPAQRQPQPQLQPAFSETQVQSPVQQQPELQRQQSQPQIQAQALTEGQSQAQQPESKSSGPPYVFDPTATYADPNVQAWAQYYARGGKELAGAVYFISVPGVTDQQPQAQAPPQVQVQAQQQPQQTVQPEDSVQRQASISSLPDPYARQLQRQSSLPSPYAEPDMSGQLDAGADLNRAASLNQVSSPVGANAPTSAPAPVSTTPSWVLPKHQPRSPDDRGYGSSPYGGGVQLRDGPVPATTA